MIQEALNNIKMHTATDNVTINMVHLSPNIVLQIKDDGRGFDLKRRLVKALRERRMGLGSMETRISLLDGNIKIKSRPGFGTMRLYQDLKQQFPDLAVRVYQCRNYGDVARIKGAVADALVKNTALRPDNILGSRETTNDNKPSAIKTEH